MSDPATGWLLAYFTPDRRDGEQVRFAVSAGPRPDDFRVLAGGAPVLRSDIGEKGARDPFLVRHASGFTVLATDLRTHDDDDWHRTTRHGSRSLLTWHSPDLTGWTAPHLIEVAPLEAGNAWAPKAFYDDEAHLWRVFWASATYDADSDRAAGSHQRILTATTRDFTRFGPPRVHLDPGHDVIDLTFARVNGHLYRFSANAMSTDPDRTIGSHILLEHGQHLLDPSFEVLAVDVGKPELERGEGPAVAVAHDGNECYLLIDEFTGRGYTLFSTPDPREQGFQPVPGARLPPHARHGSLLAITDAERDRLVGHFGADS